MLVISLTSESCSLQIPVVSRTASQASFYKEQHLYVVHKTYRAYMCPQTKVLQAKSCGIEKWSQHAAAKELCQKPYVCCGLIIKWAQKAYASNCPRLWKCHFYCAILECEILPVLLHSLRRTWWSSGERMKHTAGFIHTKLEEQSRLARTNNETKSVF